MSLRKGIVEAYHRPSVSDVFVQAVKQARPISVLCACTLLFLPSCFAAPRMPRPVKAVSEPPQPLAGGVEVVIFFGEAKPQKVFAATGAEKRRSGHRSDPRRGEQMTRFQGGGFSRQARSFGQHVVGSGGDAGLHSGVAQGGQYFFSLDL